MYNSGSVPYDCAGRLSSSQPTAPLSPPCSIRSDDDARGAVSQTKPSDPLTADERRMVEHWRRWVAQGGSTLAGADVALRPLLAIIDRLVTK